AILLSAGTGKRMNNSIPKQFLQLKGRPIILYSIETLLALKNINKIIITCPKEFIEYTVKLIRDYNLKGNFDIIEGGNSRQESVFKALTRTNADSVIIHESARPFITKSDFQKLLSHPNEN